MHKTKIELSDIDNFNIANEAEKQKIVAIFENATGFDMAHLNGQDKSSLCIHYNPELVSITNIKAILATQGYILNDKYQSLALNVSNLDCQDCVKVIEHVLKRLSGVISVYGSYTTGAFRVDYDNTKLKLSSMEQRLIALGYSYTIVNTTPLFTDLAVKPSYAIKEHQHKPDNSHDHKGVHKHHHEHKDGEIHLGCGGKHKHSEGFLGKYKELILSGITGILWMISFLVEKSGSSIFATVFLLVAYVTGGYEAFLDSIRAFMQRRFTIESLMIFAAIGAGLLGKLNEGVLLLFLFGLGHALEHFSLEKAKRSIKSLTDLSPKKALLKNDDGGTTEVLVENLQRNQIVIVKPSQIIPSDGIIMTGVSSINQAAITGESMPVVKNVGEEVFAGTINGDGLIEVQITKLASETMLSKMIRLITEAETQKSVTQKFAEKFEKIFVPIVFISILLIAILPPVFGIMAIKQSIYLAIIILVSASPCALALATPVAVLVGISRATKLGVLIKGGAALENLGRITAIAFDKTGTLTEGKPEITSIVALNNTTEEELLSLAYSLEDTSTHPLAYAVVEYAKKRGIKKMLVDSVQNVAGRGVVGIYKGQELKLGSYKMFGELATLPLNITEKIDQIENSGSTSMILSLNGEFIGLIGFADKVRDGMAHILRRLKNCGVKKNIMLTGDNYTVANAVGRLLSVDEIKAELLPEDKLFQIKQLTEAYQYTAMVGDGVNDAPAMANATVGIAMGGTKTDVAIETSNVVLMNDKLDKLPNAIYLSQNVSKIIKQNLFISLGVIVGLVIAGLFSLTNIVVAVAIHEGSTLVVIFNALRLLKVKEKE